MDKELKVLAQTPLFNGVSDRDIELLCRDLSCRRAYYEKGSVVLKRGAPVRSAGIVLSGAVQAERNSADGALNIVARHGAGELFGDVLNVSRERCSPVDIVAAEDTAVLHVPLDALMGEDGAAEAAVRTRVRLNLLSELSEKYWAQGDRVTLLRLPTLRAKLSCMLLIARREQRSDRVTIPGTREALASELGVNRSALSRELGRMQEDGLVEVRRGEFTLLDVAALQSNTGE